MVRGREIMRFTGSLYQLKEDKNMKDQVSDRCPGFYVKQLNNK